MIKIKVEGLAAIERRLRFLGPRLAGRPLARSLRRAMAPVLKEVRATAPRRQTPEGKNAKGSGQLRRSARTVVKRLPRRAGSRAIIGFGRKGAHANLLELGTQNPDGSQRIAPRHFVRKAFKRHENSLPADWGRLIWEEIIRESRR